MLYHFIVILTAGGELLTCYWFITANGILRFALIGLHILLVLVALYTLKKIKISNFLPTENYMSIAFFLSVALPFYGLLGMYLMVFAIGKIQIKKIDYFEYTYKLTPPKYKLLYSDSGLDITGIHSEEFNIEAYRDIFTKNDRQMEEVAISKLSKILTRESVAILKEVVKHATSDSKILAATALIEMENKVTKEINAIRTKLAEKPTDSDIILELARIYDLYCYLDLLDQAVEKYYRALAIEQYRTFLIRILNTPGPHLSMAEHC